MGLSFALILLLDAVSPVALYIGCCFGFVHPARGDGYCTAKLTNSPRVMMMLLVAPAIREFEGWRMFDRVNTASKMSSAALPERHFIEN